MSFRLNREVLLGDVCVLGDGAHTKVKRVSEGIPYLTSKNIKNGNIDYYNIDYMSNVDYEKLFGKSNKSIRSLEVGDILIGIIGTLGNSYIYKETDKFGISSSVGIIRAKEELINFKYLYYCINSNRFKSYTEMFKGGSVQGYTNLPTLKKIPIYLPPLEEQKAIAKILSDLDEKIEINNKINKNLEEMAQTIFKRWFVDFEFPNEEGKPYKSSGGEMVESELGMIPKGWKISELGEIIQIASGKRPKKKKKEKKDEYCIPLIGASSVMGYTEEFNLDEEVLIIGRVGTHGIVQRFNYKVWASDNTLVIKSKYIEFVSEILKQIDYSSINRGSTQPLITQTDIKKYKIILGTEKIRKEYEVIFKKNNDLYEKNKLENEKLEQVRDTLLAKLMSGEVRVPLG